MTVASDLVPVGLQGENQGRVEPVVLGPCPACGGDLTYLGFAAEWEPTEAAASDCQHCGATLQLVPRLPSDD